MSVVERFLVIKHGALGDWVLASGRFAAIRRHHPSARTTLLTTPAFAELGVRTGLDQVVALARSATCVVGNVMGPTHVAATVSYPTITLFGAGSDPIQYGPCGEAVEAPRRVLPASPPVADVIAAAELIAVLV